MGPQTPPMFSLKSLLCLHVGGASVGHSGAQPGDPPPALRHPGAAGRRGSLSARASEATFPRRLPACIPLLVRSGDGSRCGTLVIHLIYSFPSPPTTPSSRSSICPGLVLLPVTHALRRRPRPRAPPPLRRAGRKTSAGGRALATLDDPTGRNRAASALPLPSPEPQFPQL